MHSCHTSRTDRVSTPNPADEVGHIHTCLALESDIVKVLESEILQIIFPFWFEPLNDESIVV